MAVLQLENRGSVHQIGSRRKGVYAKPFGIEAGGHFHPRSVQLGVDEEGRMLVSEAFPIMGRIVFILLNTAGLHAPHSHSFLKVERANITRAIAFDAEEIHLRAVFHHVAEGMGNPLVQNGIDAPV